jgi:hypothetical protein
LFIVYESTNCRLVHILLISSPCIQVWCFYTYRYIQWFTPSASSDELLPTQRESQNFSYKSSLIVSPVSVNDIFITKFWSLSLWLTFVNGKDCMEVLHYILFTGSWQINKHWNSLGKLYYIIRQNWNKDHSFTQYSLPEKRYKIWQI